MQTHSSKEAARSQSAPITQINALLVCGMIAGPFYIVVGLIQALTRPGFDLLRHDLSLLANGDLGWIQITNLVLSGLLVLAFALGMRQVLRSSRGGTWGPLLVGVYGLGLIGAGFFTADPAFGFPPGTPADAHAISWHGLLHIITAAIGFLALIVACMVMARRFASQRLLGWAIYSVGSGLLFFAAFVGVATGSGQSWSVIGFWIGVIVIWTWIALLAVWLRKEANA
ncbi:DUF998 domain-containing protein [Ktedonosporobacter rubrisoli]|uniref:DUF998 domain-containing protein n=1 Tax=Ktedonosporobacter rubrisoli TaxID=2509675 RepID=A0A4P6JKH9_KTERU|nr:DUF998 domain-containing protein [Ktedonosporobacter rubrisoli]QBD75563.1 DUF998 domain-containing protein [Ktedonosporobacter rubrisoli]